MARVAQHDHPNLPATDLVLNNRLMSASSPSGSSAILRAKMELTAELAPLICAIMRLATGSQRSAELEQNQTCSEDANRGEQCEQ